ncbi:MAG: FtsX-like permease family protein [Luteitalea sp.]|nr:FtsX-like permease family protein [Luteitalea sp.]
MRWLLRFLVSDADRREIESDLAELYEVRRRREGTRAATRWLRRQRVLYPWHLLVDRVRAALPGATTMQHLWRDFRYSLRSLARVPVLSATIVLTVGVGLGATTAMISLVRAILVNPLPYANPGSLVWIYTDNSPYRFSLSVVDYRALEADHSTFSAIAAYQTGDVTVTEGALAERVSAKAVTGSYFPLVGQNAHVGRLFDVADDERGDRSVVLTHAYWARRFGGDASVLGRTLTVDGAGYTILGVLERTAGPLEHDVVLFTVADWATPTRKGPFFTTVLARLRPGVSRAAALDALHATNRRLFPIWRSSYQDEKATWGMLDLKERVVGEIGSILFVVLAAVGCLLLIACANAVNLLIARGLQRSRELAIRGALGASRARILQHVLVEAAALIVGAALVGLAVAAVSLQLVTARGTAYIPRIDEVRLSGAALVWLAGLSLATSIVMGLVPAWHSSRLRVDEALRASGRSTTDGRAARRVRRALVAAEFALATPLLVAGALVLASLDQLIRVPVGIDTARILTAAVSLPSGRYPQDVDRETFWKRALQRVAALPGVEAAALADSRPPDDIGIRNNFDLEDRPTPPGQNQPISPWVAASPELFGTVGLRLEQGRLLDDRSLQEDVVVVDRAWADRFFPGEEVLGRRFRSGGCTSCPWTTVVGVVGNVKWTGLDAPEDGTVYFPFVDLSNAFLVLRTTGDPGTLSQSLRRVMKELDPGLALSSVATGDELVAEALARPRYLSVLIGMFALTALVLSVIGIYGVMAYFVQQHTRDIGIRLALGGDPARVRRMIVLHGLRLVVVGVTVGIGAALVASRLMATVLFDVSATDPLTIVGVAATLVAVALIACLVPAHRAAGVDPAEVLREG